MAPIRPVNALRNGRPRGSPLQRQAGREEKDIDGETYRTYTYSNLSKHPVGHLALIVSIHPLMLALWL
jgi:hypothetical protein